MSAVEQLVRAVRRRERLRDASQALSKFALPASLVIAAGVVLGIRRLGADPLWLWLTILPVPLAVLWGLRRQRSWRATARRVDEHFALHDEIGNAWELQRTAPETFANARARDIAQLVIARAEATATALDAARVIPLRVSGPRRLDALALAALGAALLVPRSQQHVVEPWTGRLGGEAHSEARRAEAVDLARTEPLRQTLRELVLEGDGPAQLAASLLDILERLGEGQLDRAEALAELEKLEESLAQLHELFDAEQREDPEMLANALRELAEGLEREEALVRLAEALDRRDPDAVDEALAQAQENADERALAKALEEMQRRLERAAKQSSDTKQALEEAERRLRRQQQEKPRDPEEHERRLQKQRERVEQLRRQHERERAARDKLEQLRRQAEQAAQGRGSAGRQQAMDQLRQGLKGATGGVRRASQMRRLGEAMDEAKSFVRRAGKDGDAQKQRDEQFRRFAKAARGKKNDGEGSEADEDGSNGKKTTVLIEGSVGDDPDMLLTQEGRGEGRNGSEGDGSSTFSSQPLADGSGIGDGSTDALGEDDSMKTRFKDVKVDAKSGRGASRAEVIRDSSQNGFATQAYRETYQDYRSFAQSALDSEAMPARARRMVRRYYQLIQPRQ